MIGVVMGMASRDRCSTLCLFIKYLQVCLGIYGQLGIYVGINMACAIWKQFYANYHNLVGMYRIDHAFMENNYTDMIYSKEKTSWYAERNYTFSKNKHIFNVNISSKKGWWIIRNYILRCIHWFKLKPIVILPVSWSLLLWRNKFSIQVI